MSTIPTARQGYQQGRPASQYDASFFTAQLGKISAGMLYAVTGTFTCANAASTTVTDVRVGQGSVILLSPTNAAAGTLQGSAKCLYTSALVATTSFTVTTASGVAAAGTETFSYAILG